MLNINRDPGWELQVGVIVLGMAMTSVLGFRYYYKQSRQKAAWMAAFDLDTIYFACIHWRKIREVATPNNSRILDFTIYLPNFVYWVGFVTGVTFTTHL